MPSRKGFCLFGFCFQCTYPKFIKSYLMARSDSFPSCHDNPWKSKPLAVTFSHTEGLLCFGLLLHLIAIQGKGKKPVGGRDEFIDKVSSSHREDFPS